MTIKEAADNGFKHFKVKTSYGTSILSLVEVVVNDIKCKTKIIHQEFVRCTNNTTGNHVDIKFSKEVNPMTDDEFIAFSSQQDIKEDNMAKKITKKSTKETKSNMHTIIEANKLKMTDKEKMVTILKANGVKVSDNTIRYAWFLRNKAMGTKGKKFGEKKTKAIKEPKAKKVEKKFVTPKKEDDGQQQEVL